MFLFCHTRCSLALALKVEPEGLACFSQLKAETTMEINPPALQYLCGLCVCVPCRTAASWHWLFCHALKIFFSLSWKWCWGILEEVFRGSFARAKGQVFFLSGGVAFCSPPSGLLSTPSLP